MTSTAAESPAGLPPAHHSVDTAGVPRQHNHNHSHEHPPTQSHSTPRSVVSSPTMDNQDTDSVSSRRTKKSNIPKHPIPSMQEAFAESLEEVTSGAISLKPKLRTEDVQTRRERLLDQDKSVGPPAALWRLRPGQNCHELRKLIAQIAFGVYLLLKGMANSNAQVVAILQGHIDEVDEFLKTTMEDVDLATKDLTTRLEYLKLPLSNMAAFEEMLEDRSFRLRIVEGNVRIDHILSRTTTALLQSMRDISEGLNSTKEFTTYLSEEEHGSWRTEQPDINEIYEAMRGNAEGWLNAFADLEDKSNTLDVLISKLADMVAEMDSAASEVNRRTRFSVKLHTLPEQSENVLSESQESQESLETQETHGSREITDSRISSAISSRETTPPLSPTVHVPQSPPRLSLRLSKLDSDLSPSFLDIGSDDSVFGTDDKDLQYTPPPETSANAAFDKGIGSSENHNSEQSKDSVSIRTKDTGDATANADAVSIPLHIDVGTPKADASSMTAGQSDADSTRTRDKDEEVPLFLLQPRTYTPKPPAPLPSPLVHESDRNSFLSPAPLPTPSEESDSPPHFIPPIEERLSQYDSSSPPAQTQSRPLRTISSRVRDEDQQAIGRQASFGSNSLSSSSGHSVEAEATQLKTHGSIRDRVSLRTAPPEAIHVPPLNSQLQRPVFASPRTYQNYRTFTGPDSANSPELDRSTMYTATEVPISSSNTSSNNMPNEFSPPTFPNLLPSPQSDQQYFRPVQASPHSPLQQRPHTAGQVPTRPTHLRNMPSSMGMSMMSTTTTTTQGSGSGRTLKKKRSAFGWLKKAFTLDEDERIDFDQRKNTKSHNPYYDDRSPQFLDGKRIR